MTVAPADFAPLVTDYAPDWDERPTAEGEHFEHAHFLFDNGYGVSIVRTNQMSPEPSFGFEDGLWEGVAFERWDHNPLLTMFTGQIGGPLQDEELDHRLHETQAGESTEQSCRVRGYMDNAGVNTFLAEVAALPVREVVQ